MMTPMHRFLVILFSPPISTLIKIDWIYVTYYKETLSPMNIFDRDALENPDIIISGLICTIYVAYVPYATEQSREDECYKVFLLCLKLTVGRSFFLNPSYSVSFIYVLLAQFSCCFPCMLPWWLSVTLGRSFSGQIEETKLIIHLLVRRKWYHQGWNDLNQLWVLL